MISFAHFSAAMFPTGIFLLELKSGSLFYYLVISIIAIFLLVIYFLIRDYKRKFAYKSQALNKRISLLKDNNETLTSELKSLKTELADLQIKLKEAEIEKVKWLEGKEKLEEEIKRLKIQIQKLENNDDIIIEYYTKEKSDE
jgi:peptidoglycan hydrolase CwlO-like protein